MKKLLTIIIIVIIVGFAGLFIWKNTNKWDEDNTKNLNQIQKTIKKGDTVNIKMKTTTSDNEIYEEKELTFVLGVDVILPIIENNITEMKEWETKTFHANSEEAYWINHDPNKVQILDPTIFETTKMPEIWETLDLGAIKWLVTAVNETGIVLDLNDPITYQDMDITIEVIEIE